MQNNKTIIISIIILVIVLALAVAVWYFYFRTPSINTYAPATAPKQQSVQPGSNTPSADSSALSAGDTTADIAKDLDQTFDESAANNELNSLDQNLQTF